MCCINDERRVAWSHLVHLAHLAQSVTAKSLLLLLDGLDNMALSVPAAKDLANLQHCQFSLTTCHLQPHPSWQKLAHPIQLPCLAFLFLQDPR